MYLVVVFKDLSISVTIDVTIKLSKRLFSVYEEILTLTNIQKKIQKQKKEAFSILRW